MISLATFVTPPHECAYRPEQTARMKYDVVLTISAAEYEKLMADGWRHFGHSLFTHDCPECRACQSIRIPVAQFEMNRSQRRAWQANQDLTLSVHEPAVSPEKLDLYDKFHQARADSIGWPDRGPKDGADYVESFVNQPFRVEEWQYRLNGELVGVGYVDPLPHSLSAIYFFHDPDHPKRSLGTFNVLSVIDRARDRGLEYVYLGYFVEGCRSLEYKARFTPNETRTADGQWKPFR